MSDFEAHPVSEPTPSEKVSGTSEAPHLSFSEAENLEDLRPDRLEHLERCGYCRNLVDTLNPTERLLLDFSDRTKGVVVEDVGTSRKAVALGGWIAALSLALILAWRGVPETSINEASDAQPSRAVALAAEATPFWLVESGGKAVIVLTSPNESEEPAGYFTSVPLSLGQRIGRDQGTYLVHRIPLEADHGLFDA